MKKWREIWPLFVVAIVSSIVTSAFILSYTRSSGYQASLINPSSNSNKQYPNDKYAKSNYKSNIPVEENAVIMARRKIAPAVVYIDTVRTISGPQVIPDIFREFFPGLRGPFEEQKREQRGTGSGFIVDSVGHILTNEHVVRGADKLMVTLQDGRKYKGYVIGSDQKTDLAIVKIDAKNLPYAELGDSNALEPGQWVVAIGNPFGFHQTVTFGIISALGRSLENPDESGYLIQTDAAINPGNSGGPLIDLKGRVVGINEAILSQAQGMGFAIPINLAKENMNELIQKGKISRPPVPWIGVAMLPLNEELIQYLGINFKNGVYVESIAPNSPAAKAGFRAGDVIKEMNRKVMNSPESLVKAVKAMKVGQKVSLLVWRDNKFITITLRLAARPEELN
jgi:serine protease Do